MDKCSSDKPHKGRAIMNYLSMMTDEDIRYICSVIPIQESVKYFKRYPKDFAKVMPGFRATSLKSKELVSGALFRCRNQDYISSFIENHISRWLEEISKAWSDKIDEGHTRETAMLITLVNCYFADNIGLYFKLTGDEYTEEYIKMLGVSIKIIRENESKYESIGTVIKDKTNEIEQLKIDLNRVKARLDIANQKIRDCRAEIKVSKRLEAQLEKQKDTVKKYEQLVDILKQEINQHQNSLHLLQNELSTMRDQQSQLEDRIRVELEKQNVEKQEHQSVEMKPKSPIDIDDFKEFLGYNLEDIGVRSNTEYFKLLVDYLCEILFQGKPIIISKSTGISLMKCISNALLRTPVVPTLAFSSDIIDEDIHAFLSKNNRMICLDNFIGNYNETTLATICGKHKNKIVFITTVYDRTLNYVPNEIMVYCHYVNLNRVEALTEDKELTEDPSAFEEAETSNGIMKPHDRWSRLLEDILCEVGILGSLPSHLRFTVTDEVGLCRLLAFCILPYCVDVLKISPFSGSDRFTQYAGENGKCPYKDLFKRWFAF